MTRDLADPDQQLRKYLKQAIRVVIQHKLQTIYHMDSVSARDCAERITEAASNAADRAALRVDVARGQLGGMLQRISADIAKELGPQLRDAARVGSALVMPERQIADAYDKGLTRELQRYDLQLRDPSRGQRQANEQASRRLTPTHHMYKTGRPGRVIPEAGRQQARDRQRERGR